MLEGIDSAENGSPLTPKTMPRAELRDVIDISLWVGQLLLQHGADSQRVETTVHHVGTGLGCSWLDVFVSANTIIITTVSGVEFRTKIRRIVRFGGVDMNVLTRISQLSYLIEDGMADRFAVRRQLEAIDQLPRFYPTWLTIGLVGLACAAFSQLFGGDWVAFGLTFVATMAGMAVRHWLMRHYFNTFFVVVLSAFVATLVTALGLLLGLLPPANIALAACVLFLVPGVPLVNAIEDLISGHTNVGIARGVSGTLISLGIAIGLVFTFSITGIADGLPDFQPVPTVWEDAGWAAVAALGFAVLFNIPPRILLGSVVAATVGRAVRTLLIGSGVGVVAIPEVATLFGAMAIGFLGQRMARYWRVPSVLFTVSGIIPMIPGTFAFGTMISVLTFAGGTDSAESAPLLIEAAANAIKTGLILTALATGIVIPSLLFSRRKPVI
jgi:uncharacterized membrane protein YjjP (DUF1212 family)